MSETHEETPAVPAVTEAPADPAQAADVAVPPPAVTAGADAVEAPATETPAAAESPAAEKPAEPASLLSAEPEKPVEGAEAAVEPFAYEPFTLPEGVEADPERMGAFTALIGEHKLPQEAAQKLIDLYLADRQAQAEAAEQHGRDAFADMRREWVQKFESDPEIGGNRRDTSLNAARTAIRQFASNEAHLNEVWQAMALTGFGDHPAAIKLFVNAARMFAERPKPPAGAPPQRANGAARDPAEARYPSMTTSRSP